MHELTAALGTAVTLLLTVSAALLPGLIPPNGSRRPLD